MKVREFCYYHTKVGELCVIRDSGWIKQPVWIDHEDLFAIHPNLSKREVKSTSWGELKITTEHGNTIKVPCHYIDT